VFHTELISSRTDTFSTQVTGFSICHPMYDNKFMLKVVQHATASALKIQDATATFLLLPNFLENSTNAFHKTCTDKDVCTILRNVLNTKVRYMPLLYQQSKTPPLPEATCMGHTHLSSLEQSCQGAIFYKQLILGKKETRPVTSGNLEC